MTMFDAELTGRGLALGPSHRPPPGSATGAILLGNLLRRWPVFLALFLCGAIGSGYAATRFQRGYTAEAVVVLNPRRDQILEGLSAFGSLQLDTAAMNTETSLFTFPELILKVVRTLDLASAAPPVGPEGSFTGFVSRILGRSGERTDASAGADGSAGAERAASGPTPQEARAIDEFLRRLDVVNDPRSFTIRIRYNALDPVRAAEGANAVAELEIANQRDARMQAVRESGAWLNTEIAALQARVGRAESEEQAFRRSHGLGDEKTASIAQQEVNAYALQATLAGAASSQAQARLMQSRTGVVAALEEDVRVAADREANVRREFEAAQARLRDVQAAEAALRPLTREAAAGRALLEDLMRRARNAEFQISAQRPEARLVSRALVPTKPAGWGPSRLVPIAVAGSAVVSALVVLLLAALGKGFGSARELQRCVEAEVVGETPHVPDCAQSLCRLLDDAPMSHPSEAARAIVARLVRRTNDCTVVLVTAPASGTGASMLAITLAKAAGAAGRKCLLIDANLRGPSTHVTLGIPCQPGLFELLARQTTLDRALHRKAAGAFDYLAAGSLSDDPLKILAPAVLEPQLAQLRKRYDLILVDSPPMTQACDGAVLAPHADLVLLAVRWRSTTGEAVRRSLDALARLKHQHPLLVLTQVERRGARDRDEAVPDTRPQWPPAEAPRPTRSASASGRARGARPVRSRARVAVVEALPVGRDLSS